MFVGTAEIKNANRNMYKKVYRKRGIKNRFVKKKMPKETCTKMYRKRGIKNRYETIVIHKIKNID
jgi:hypothetical protein